MPMARWMMIPVFCFLLLPSLLFGQQAVTMEPADATVDSTVTIYFDADRKSTRLNSSHYS